MKVVMHFPTTGDAQAELKKRIAAFHAKAIIDYVNSLPCSKDEKTAFIDSIIDNHRKGK